MDWLTTRSVTMQGVGGESFDLLNSQVFTTVFQLFQVFITELTSFYKYFLWYSITFCCYSWGKQYFSLL